MRVTEVKDKHNHGICKVRTDHPGPVTNHYAELYFFFQAIYDHLPRQRKVDDCQQREAQNLLQMPVNKKLLQQHMNEKTGKIVTLKDISNIQTRMNSHADRNDINSLVTRLRAITGMLLDRIEWDLIIIM